MAGGGKHSHEDTKANKMLKWKWSKEELESLQEQTESFLMTVTMETFQVTVFTGLSHP